jgi:hypothetical protein
LTPPASLPAGEVHGDAVFQLDDLAAAAGGGARIPFTRTCQVAGRPAFACAAGRVALRASCGDPDDGRWCLRQAASLALGTGRVP